MSAAHLLWLLTGSTLRPMIFIALFEFGLEAGHIAEFSGADRREILGVGEQDGPAIAHPFVKMDGALRGFGGEIRSGVVDAQHVLSPRLLMSGFPRVRTL